MAISGPVNGRLWGDCHGRRQPWRVHGRYERRLADATVGTTPTAVRLTVRRFKCLSPGCPTVTSAEQIPGLTTGPCPSCWHESPRSWPAGPGPGPPDGWQLPVAKEPCSGFCVRPISRIRFGTRPGRGRVRPAQGCLEPPGGRPSC
ncbi:transposase family protein [Streptomyces sp. NRRL F-2664]|uniref:transposase family protein n=1 Tax=Streptomyces sp. NRRL F-2664 TaxID=1463842 RepID=UPI003B6381B4